MSFEKYIELMQILITMTNPKNEDDVLYARNILRNLQDLARSSQKVDAVTFRTMVLGEQSFTSLLRRKDDFAGKPGDYAGNHAKRLRLAMLLRPTC